MKRIPGNFFFDMILICMEKKNTGIHRDKNGKKNHLIKAMSGLQNIDVCFVQQTFCEFHRFSSVTMNSFHTLKFLFFPPRNRTRGAGCVLKAVLRLLSELM